MECKNTIIFIKSIIIKKIIRYFHSMLSESIVNRDNMVIKQLANQIHTIQLNKISKSLNLEIESLVDQ